MYVSVQRPRGEEPSPWDRVSGSCVAYAFPLISMGRSLMLRYPMHGFAKRVDDSVARAMIILQNREDYTARRTALFIAPKPHERRPDQRPQ
jgi:hypothetical protein